MVQDNQSPIRLQGRSVAPGETAAPICLYSYKNYQKAAIRIRRKDLTPEKEVARYNEAMEYCEKDIFRLRQRVATEIGEAEAAVFDAQLALLKDPTMSMQIIKLINEKSQPFEDAVEEVFSHFEEKFAQLNNEYLRERTTDIGEVKRRLLHFGYETEPGFVCTGQKFCGRGYQSIIVAEELTAEMIMEIDLSRIRGIITEHGGVNGHAAILARAAGIPAITGVEGAMDYARCGDKVYLNGGTGECEFFPSDELFNCYNISSGENEIPVEKSVQGVEVLANCSSIENAISAKERGADGIGLFRTEMLFLNRGKLLNEEEQTTIYSEVCKILDDKPVTFRLLDIGGDKALPFLNITPEENPFLGFRGARFLLGNRDILRTQIKALLRTSQTYPLNLMMPMIVDLKQFKKIQEEIKQCANEISVSLDNINIGIMFEVPSAIFEAPELLAEADFGSIGSNDLMQYLFAVDRNNDLVADDYDKDHPVLWKCMEQVAKAGIETNTKISLCGEIASYPGYATRLFDVGITNLSVSPQLIPGVRQELNRAANEASQESL